MAFEYGSIDLGIRNPFRIEGAIRSVAGALIAILGIVAVFSVQNLVASGEKTAGWVSLGIGLILILWGLWGLTRGLFQLMRFFVGRGAPTSLAKNLSKSEKHTEEDGVVYSAPELEQMLQGRKNLTFVEPSDWFSHLVHSVFRPLLFMPYAYRNMTQRLSEALTQTLFAMLCYGLAWFSGVTGLSDVTATPVLDWLGAILTVYLFWVWWGKRRALDRRFKDYTGGSSVFKIALWIVAAILLPFALSLIHNTVHPLPEMPVSAGSYVFLILALGLITTGLSAALITLRARSINPVVEVAEYRDNWQENIHPQEIFINFENIVMANRRYKEVPNRVYRDFDANLIEEGSDDKGRFGGEMIQETQPVYKEMAVSPAYQWLRVAGTALGFSLLVASAVMLYANIGTFTTLFAPSVTTQNIIAAAESLLYVFTLLLFGMMIVNHVHAFWSEMLFESLMVYFQCTGTYTESKLSTGTSIYDSTRSENTVVRSSLTPWVIASRIVTSSFTESGRHNLEYPRHVLEMHKSEEELSQIIDEIRGFVSKREAIASINNEKDLAAASRIFEVNKQTRAALGEGQDKHPPISQEQLEASGSDTEES